MTKVKLKLYIKNENSKNEMKTLSRKEKEQIVRKADILGTAERLFATKGFFKTTMMEIAKESEFPIATIYHFFKSKEDIYFKLIEERVERLFENVRRAVSQATTSVERIKEIIRTELKFFEDQKDFFKIFVTERSGFEWTVKEDLGKKINRMYITYINFIQRIIEQGIKRGEFKELNSKDMANALTGAINAIIFQWILNPGGKSLMDKEETLLAIVFKGFERKD